VAQQLDRVHGSDPTAPADGIFAGPDWLTVGIDTSITPERAAPNASGLLRAQVERTIEVIRPALQADGGDIILHDVDEGTGVVKVELIGACVGCPASTQTLKAGIERIMRDRIDGVTEVIDVA
jgi:Fe-S cluster biogenesis protein NfuA